MYDIAVGVVGILAAGHYDEILVTRVDDLDVVHSELTVKRHRNDGLHGALVKEKLSDLNIRNLHIFYLRCCENLSAFRTLPV